MAWPVVVSNTDTPARGSMRSLAEAEYTGVWVKETARAAPTTTATVRATIARRRRRTRR